MNKAAALREFFESFISEHKRALFHKVLQHRTYYLQVVLDVLEDPLDANAAFRSCECFGIQKVHWLQAPGMHKRRRGISVGSTKWLDLQSYTSSATACAKNLRAAGIRQYALSTRPGSMPLGELPLDQPLALWFASEHSGVREDTAAAVDGFVHLPMLGHGEHFNFSVTVALALQLVTQRLRDEKQAWQLNALERDQLLLEWYATIPKKRKLFLQRFLEERALPMESLAPPVTSQRFWNLFAD